MICTAVSHPNKAIVIYWGNADDRLNIPSRASLSMTLEGVDRLLDYTATLKTLKGAERDVVVIDGREDKGQIHDDIVLHLDAMREFTGFRERLAVYTEKTFPIGSGLAGSAAAASALAEAFAGIVGGLDRKKISIMARRGSGSAARSVLGGYVKLSTGGDEESFALQLHDENQWDLRDVIAIVDPGQKRIKSRDGMRMSTKTCPPEIYSEFVGAAEPHIQRAQTAIAQKDIQELGIVYEFDNAMFRKVCMNTAPPLDYWSEGTKEVFRAVAKLRSEGMLAYAGTDAGPNVHILCEPSNSQKLIGTLKELEGVKDIIHARPGRSSALSDKHLG